MGSDFSGDLTQASLGGGTTRTMLIVGRQLGPYLTEAPLGDSPATSGPAERSLKPYLTGLTI